MPLIRHRRGSGTRVAAPLALAAGAVLVAIATQPAGASHVGASAEPVEGPSFVDPTARGFDDVRLGALAYVAPFAVAVTDDGRISIGDEANVQDQVLLDADEDDIAIGDLAILAHNAAVVGPATVGESGVCPGGAPECFSFVGFNSVVDGAVVEKDTLVQAMARVAPGVTIPSGRKVLPGRYVRSNAEVAAKTEPVTDADRAFMAAVVEVNTEFAEGYHELEEEDRSNVFGINVNPQTTFNDRGLPTFAGVPTRLPWFRNRVIGDVRLADTVRAASARMGEAVSLRADEGEPFVLGALSSEGVDDRATMHALEFSEIVVGAGASLGYHSVVHGGGPRGPEDTGAGRNLRLGDFSTLFRSQAGDDVTIGAKSLVQGTRLPSGTRVPSCTVIVNGVTTRLEWCSVPFPGVDDEEVGDD